MGLLTDREIKSAQAGKTSIELRDGKGLFLIIAPTGRRSWVARSARNRRTLGAYPEMSLADARREIMLVKAPMSSALASARLKTMVSDELKERGCLRTADDIQNHFTDWLTSMLRAEQSMTVSQAFAHYMGSDGGKISRPAERWRAFERDIEKVIGERKLNSITRDDLSDLVKAKFDDIIEDGGSGKGSNNFHALLSAFFTWCTKRGYAATKLAINPMANVTKLTSLGQRDRKLSEDELVWLTHSLFLAGDFADPFRLILRSGCRRSEILDLTVSMVRLDDAKHGPHLALPTSKNGEPQRIPLTAQMIALLPSLEGLGPDDIIWRNSRRHDRPALNSNAVSNPKSRVEERMAEMACELGHNKPIERWTVHDWRTTFSTVMNDCADASNGIDPLHIEQCLGHTIQGVAGVYNRADYTRQRRNVLEHWNDYLDGVSAK